MTFYHTLLKEAETRQIAATCKEEAWDYSRTGLNPGDYVWELVDLRRRHRVSDSFRRGNTVYEDQTAVMRSVLPVLGTVLAYCDSKRGVRFWEPFSYVG